MPSWLRSETKFLEENYLLLGAKGCGKELPRHSINAIAERAKLLRLTRPKRAVRERLALEEAKRIKELREFNRRSLERLRALGQSERNTG